MTRALKITAVGRTRMVEVESFGDYEREVGGFVSTISLCDDHVLVFNGAATNDGYRNDLAIAAVAHLGSDTNKKAVIRGTVLVVRVEESGIWGDIHDTIDREICGLAALLRY